MGTSGVPEEIAFDGGPQFQADNTNDFLTRWGVRIRPSATYHPLSNGRAELAVKSVKRTKWEMWTKTVLSTQKHFAVFGRKLRDTLPRVLF